VTASRNFECKESGFVVYVRSESTENNKTDEKMDIALRTAFRYCYKCRIDEE